MTAALAALSWFAFGEASWNAFLAWIPTTSHVVLGQGGADFSRLQSLFGLVRTLGGGETLAWQLRGGCAGLLAVTVMLTWHSSVAFELKAAALSCAELLATPYLYIYDRVALTIPVAFLLRFAFARGLLPSDAIGLIAAVVLLLSYPYAQAQVGVAATVIVAALIVQRIVLAARGESTASLTPA